MTDNNTVAKLNDLQTRLSGLASSINKVAVAAQDLNHSTTVAYQELNKLLPILESVAHDIAWKDATSINQVPANQPQSAIELLNAFKAAMRAPVGAGGPIKLSDLSDPIKAFNGVMKPAPVAPPVVPKPAASAFVGTTLTDQAREILKTTDYFDAISVLHALHPGAQRDNIRRAVARAAGR